MMNNDNRFDELLQKAAQQYNQPPAIVPRDEMWAAIEKAQAERAVRPMRIVAAPTHRPLARYRWIGAAAAAVLLVATGVGIGRWSMESGAPAESVKKSVAPAPAAVARIDTDPAPEIESAREVTSAPEIESARETSPVRTAPTRVAGVTPRAGSETVRSGTTTRSGAGTTLRAGDLPTGSGYGSVRPEGPYQVAANRHLANAEALLTAFRTDSRDARMDAQLSTWARDLLSNTRLLLDSPAADDPQRARLLGDLELVLAQIVQLSPGAAAQDRELIEGSIQSGQVMSRLRTAIPAGPTRGL
ncbi:MAG: hypothetical protein M3O61_14070 [Gemmatimonadota bacterium]|nr:hypothetical protein [Gemmatimonadota bacterium]